MMRQSNPGKTIARLSRAKRLLPPRPVLSRVEPTAASRIHRLRRSPIQARRITWRRPHPPGGEITEEKGSNRKGIAHSEMGAINRERHTHPEISTILITLLDLETDLHADLPAHAHTGPIHLSLQTDLRTDLMALLGLAMDLDTGPVRTGLLVRSADLGTDLHTGPLLNPDLGSDLYKGLLADTRLRWTTQPLPPQLRRGPVLGVEGATL